MLENHHDVLTIKELQDILNIKRTKAYELVRSGAIKSFKVGNRLQIPKCYVVEFIESGCYNDRTTVNGCSGTIAEVVT